MKPLRLPTFVILLFIASTLITSFTVQAQNIVSEERLAYVDEVLQRYVDENRVAGAVGLVMRDGDIIYERAVGWADREAGLPMTTDTIFRIASQTKAITSAAVMMLVEQGKINLNEPIHRWMPTFKGSTVGVHSDSGLVVVPARRAITVHDLLTHTAGISYGRERHTEDLYKAQGLGYAGPAYGWYTAHKEETLCDTMDRLGPLPMAAQPGERWVYGYNTDILGCIVERVSGKPLDEFFQEFITAPLGMRDTFFFLPASHDKKRLAAVYSPDASGTMKRAEDGARGQGHYVDGPRRNFAAGAGLLSTARDYARFLEMIRNEGTLAGHTYLSPHAVALMNNNQSGTLHSTNGLGFGLGFQTIDRVGAKGLASKGAFGWSGAYGTVYEVDPEEKLVIVLMVQVLPYYGSGIREAFKSAVYGALIPANKP